MSQRNFPTVLLTVHLISASVSANAQGDGFDVQPVDGSTSADSGWSSDQAGSPAANAPMPQDRDAATADGAPAETIGVAVRTNAPVAPPRSRALQEITVTATKRARLLRDIPSSIDAYTGNDLEQRGVGGLEELMRLSPGVTVNAGLDPDAAYLSIRGITADSSGGFYTRPTGLFFDDISLMNPSLQGIQPDLDPFDMARVEVLKGPQGTLFGGSALSGAVRYVPARPDPAARASRASVGFSWLAASGDMARKVLLMHNQPLSKRLALRVAGTQRSHAGVIDDLHSGVDDINSSRAAQGRLMLLWNAGAGLRLELTHLRREVEADDGNNADNVFFRDVGTRRVPNLTDSTTALSSLLVDWDFGPASLEFNAALVDKDSAAQLDGSALYGTYRTTTVIQPYFMQTRQPTYELRLVSNSPVTADHAWLRGWEYVAGLFRLQADQMIDTVLITEDQASGARSTAEDAFYGALATETAAYFDLSRRLGTAWTLHLGGRYFRQLTQFESIHSGSDGGTPVTPPNVSGNNIRGRLPETGFNPKFALGWRAKDSLRLHLSASRGYRFGGGNLHLTVNDQAPPFFNSDSLWNYELGLRSDWRAGLLQADLTLFYLDWDNLQVERSRVLLRSYIDNLGSARSQGVELAVRALLSPGLLLTVSGTYVDARTTEGLDDNPDAFPAGTRLPATPHLSSATVLGWRGQFGAWPAAGTLTWTWQSRSPNNLRNQYFLPGYSMLGAAFRASRAIGHWQPRVQLQIDNLLDKQVVTGAFTEGAGGVWMIQYAQPRSLTLTLGVDF